MTFLCIYFLALAVILALMFGLWIVSVVIEDASIVDIFWGLGFVILGLLYFVFTDGYGVRKVLVVSLLTIWGLRLAGHIGYRNLGQGEDKRYQRMRRRYGTDFWWVSLFLVFGLQGFLIWFISAPLLAAQFGGPYFLTIFDMLAVPVWLVGFAFEAIGDWQLMRFKADPHNAGQVMNKGLWRYTRHPNYFGDMVLWWGYYVFAIATPWGFLTFLSPIVMNYLLVYVSGVRLLERNMRTNPKYREYIKRTSPFFPRPPRRLQRRY